MKRLWLLIPALILCMLMPVSCAKGGENMQKRQDMPGGTRDLSDPDAPKVVLSKDISSFAYEFNTRHLVRPVQYGHCGFKLVRQEADALCTGRGGGEFNGDVFGFEFTVPLSTLDALQTIIDEHGLARHNGMDLFGQGLPDNYGASLLVKYASGERIYAYNNKMQFMSVEATAALFDFFRALAKEAGCDFLHTPEEISEFQDRVAGRWQGMENAAVLEFSGNSVKIYMDQQLIDDTAFIMEYDRLYNAHTKDGSFARYKYIERLDGALIATDKSGNKTGFVYWPDASGAETEPADSAAMDAYELIDYVLMQVPEAYARVYVLRGPLTPVVEGDTTFDPALGGVCRNVRLGAEDMNGKIDPLILYTVSPTGEVYEYDEANGTWAHRNADTAVFLAYVKPDRASARGAARVLINDVLWVEDHDAPNDYRIEDEDESWSSHPIDEDTIIFLYDDRYDTGMEFYPFTLDEFTEELFNGFRQEGVLAEVTVAAGAVKIIAEVYTP